jgi:hypothetical protein
VVKDVTILETPEVEKRPTFKDGRFLVVEMRRLELLTPYMRSKVLPSIGVARILKNGRTLWRRRRC